MLELDFYSSFPVQATMARLQLLSLLMILMVCWSGQHVEGQGLYLCVQDTCTQIWKIQCKIIIKFLAGNSNVKRLLASI